GLVVRQARRTLHLANDRKKRTVGVLRRTEIPQARVRFRSDVFQQGRRQSGLAYTSLAGKEHHLTFASLCLRPAPQQKFEFFFPSNKLGQVARVESLEPAF